MPSPSGGSLSLARLLIPLLYHFCLTPSCFPIARLGFFPSPSQPLLLPCCLLLLFLVLSLSLSGTFPHLPLSSSIPISHLPIFTPSPTLRLPTLLSGIFSLTIPLQPLSSFSLPLSPPYFTASSQTPLFFFTISLTLSAPLPLQVTINRASRGFHNGLLPLTLLQTHYWPYFSLLPSLSRAYRQYTSVTPIPLLSQ